MVRSAGNSTYNYDNPVSRDVVSIGLAGDNVTFRFFTDNPGPWFLHCHIDWHLNASVLPPSFVIIPILKGTLVSGFAAVFAEDILEIDSEVHPTGKSLSGLCLL